MAGEASQTVFDDLDCFGAPWLGILLSVPLVQCPTKAVGFGKEVAGWKSGASVIM